MIITYLLTNNFMPIVLTGIVPHPPVLLESIGKEHRDSLKKTIESLHQLNQDLIKNKVDTIIVISSHAPQIPQSFTLNLGKLENNEMIYQADLKEYGDFQTEFSWKPDIYLSYKIKSYLETRAPLQLINQDKLDYGSLVPLSFLCAGLEDCQVLSLSPSNLDNETHRQLGRHLKEIFSNEDKNIAIFVSGDLSHRIDEKLNPEQLNFDTQLLRYLEQGQGQEITKWDPEFIKQHSACVFQPLLIMIGLLEDYQWKFIKLSYEAPFGVGYLSGYFKLH
jgi:aromatic ring-opening dioxygenase LigB subunit